MILYRARTLASRPRRHPAFIDNLPSTRVKGRWFTSDLEAAYRHFETLEGESEIVAVEIADDIVDSFRVATTPNTQCGLSPIDFSADPETDYVISMFMVVSAEAIDMVSEEDAAAATRAQDGRVRDYIDVRQGHGGLGRTDIVRRVAQDRDLPHVDLPLAA